MAVGDWPWGAWTAIAALITLHVVIGGVLVRLMDRINGNEASAKEAKENALKSALLIAAEKLHWDKLQTELIDLRISVVRDYVSKDTMIMMENRILKAIEALGVRLDGLFSRQEHA